ncbi:MAG: shikimate dehydrogenase [Chloroflexi bacterium]|nr:shikimate dehydrogenase [Chloroflexota bacterium]
MSDRGCIKTSSLPAGTTITGRTRIVGVIGHPVGHSLSPAMHNAAFQALGLDYCYVPFDVAPEAVTGALQGIRALGLAGINVTIPHKPAVYREMDVLAPSARAVGAVNTVEVHEGLLIGHNTDGEGFARSLECAGVPLTGQRVALIGAGGAARSVAAACVQRAAASMTILSRRPEQALALSQSLTTQSLIDDGPTDGKPNDGKPTGESRAGQSGVDQTRSAGWRRDGASCPTRIVAGDLAGGEESVVAADIVVQCTPVGMHPRIDDPLPIPASWLRAGMVVVDLIYNPEETRLLKAARERGAKGINGVEMLVCQGAVAFEIWTGTAPSLSVMRDALLAALRDRS